MKFDTLTREQLEDELRRCNEQMLKDGDEIGRMRSVLMLLQSDHEYGLAHDMSHSYHHSHRLGQIKLAISP